MNPSDTPSHSHLLRSKRTRNTSGPEDSVKLPATKKRRSALRRDTFEPLTDASINELAGRAQNDSKTNGHAIQPAHPPPRSDSQPRDLTLRGGKKTEKRSERGVGLSTLSTNDFYTVSQLPALPEQIRARPTVAYSCVISPENDYILAVTPTDALVWSYNASASTPSSRELLNFKLPFPSASTNDPLPLAAFTAKSANGEPGIVIVSPKWGKIVYWETLSSASSYAPSQPSHGVQGSIPGMFSGEVVKDLVSAEPAGFILSLASGRVAQLTVRDQVGRPGIGVQFMRKSAAATARGGIFGSIRSAFGADRRKGTAIARPGKVARAQRDIILCTEDGDLEFWTNNLLTGNNLTKAISIKAQILSGLDTQIEQDQLQQPIDFKVVDFVLASTPTSSDLIRSDDAESLPLTVLVSVSSQAQSQYYLVETTIANDDVQIRVVHPVRCRIDYVAGENSFQPRICIPPTSTTAFVIFEKSVVIMSLAKIAESPSSQLTAEKETLPVPFQDIIRLQDNTVYRIINFAGEDAESGSSCVLAIQGFGIVRVGSHISNDNEIEVEDVVSRLSAKAKIEQAIFFGTSKSNPLDLRQSVRSTYETKEIRDAISNISRGIITSTSQYIPKSSSSIAEHLQQRARTQQDLVDYALKMYPDCLGRAERILLLWNAEKIGAARALWEVQERIQTTYPKKDERENTYLNFALSALAENRQKYPNPEKGETDHVRHWLIYSVNNIGRLLTELEDCMAELLDFGINDPTIVCDYYLEGTELWTAAYQAAFKYRENNAAAYGLGNETYEQGVLKSGYPSKLPIAWTSAPEQLHSGQHYVMEATIFLSEWWNYSASQQNGSANPKMKKIKQMPTNIDGEIYDAPSKALLEKLADRLPEQVDLIARALLENSIQERNKINSSDDPQNEKDHKLHEEKDKLRDLVTRLITNIAPYNRAGSLKLAEEQGDCSLLVDLNLDYLKELATKSKLHPENESELRAQIREVQNNVETYFEKFGHDWAYAHFSKLVKEGELGRLVGEGQVNHGAKQSYLSWFFETCVKQDKRLGKIAWVNDVLGEGKFDAAHRTLETVAGGEETDIWSKKTELCLAKLAGLAALESNAPAANETKVDNISYELEYLQIIESLAYHINSALYDAVDDEAAVQLASELYIPKAIINNKKASQTRKHLSSTLYKLVTNQVIGLTEIVDALTLLDLGTLQAEETDTDVDDVSGSEFPYALQAIDLASLRDVTTEQKKALRNTVWRRLLIKDDWVSINNTSGKSDKQVKEIMQRTVLFRTLLDLSRRAELDNIDVRIPSVNEVLQMPDNETVNEEVKAELAQLKKFVDKARLIEHFSGLVKEAKDELRRWQDMEGDAQAEEVLTNGNGVINGNHS